MEPSFPFGVDGVRVSVPATPDCVHILRTVTGAVAGRLTMPVDDVDDLRLAVDEACGFLLDLRDPPSRLRLRLTSHRDHLEVVVAAEAGVVQWPPDGHEQTLAWRILCTLAEHVRFEWWNGAPSIRVLKRTLVGQPS